MSPYDIFVTIGSTQGYFVPDHDSQYKMALKQTHSDIK